MYMWVGFMDLEEFLVMFEQLYFVVRRHCVCVLSVKLFLNTLLMFWILTKGVPRCQTFNEMKLFLDFYLSLSVYLYF